MPFSQRLFSPYVQTEIGRRQGGKGSGLGLALVRQIVRLSSGRLGVDSEYGKGSVFWFELPYALPPPSKSRAGRDTATGPLAPGPGHRSGAVAHGAMGVPTIDEESTSVSAAVSPDLDEKDDPLEAIEHRETTQQYLSKTQAAAAALGTSSDAPQRIERPRMSETESTIPLLSDSTRKGSGESTTKAGQAGQRRVLMVVAVPTEEVIVTTYPPPDSSSSTDSSIDHTEAAIVAMQSQQRRESAWTAESSSRRGSEAVSTGGQSKREEEPPLSAFVVDDDK